MIWSLISRGGSRGTARDSQRWVATCCMVNRRRGSGHSMLLTRSFTESLSPTMGAMSPLMMRVNMRCMRATLFCSASEARVKGKSPVSITNRDTPIDHTSAVLPSYCSSNSTSGAMYSGVPHVDLLMDAISSLLYPKSQMRSRGLSPPPCSSMLSNLMSRLAMPRRWQNSTAHTSCCMNHAASSSVMGAPSWSARLSMYSDMSPLLQAGITIAKCPLMANTSRSSTMLGWRPANLWFCSSRRMWRSSKGVTASPYGKNLMATS
mmetsp:Transcript_2232/g.6632  ORF Transcript_2232/g.6632 Transcript_2232/m.6632 type:complete len:263 (+) Transcript_2232:1755-2543(+)